MRINKDSNLTEESCEEIKVHKPLEGFRDIFGVEKRSIEYIKWKIAQLFQLWGYDIIEIPLIEKISSFDEDVVGYSPWPEWDRRGCFSFEINDYVGNYTESPTKESVLLVPEGTISVSRWLAGKLLRNDENTSPSKIFYITPCFRNELIDKLSLIKNRQFDQVGLEVLGVQSKNADIESVLLTAKGLEYIGFDPKGIIIRISSVEIFNRLADESQLGPAEKVTVKEFLDKIAESRASKDRDTENSVRKFLMKWLDEMELPEKIKKFWILLSEKNGAGSLPKNISQPALFYIEELHRELSDKFNINAQIDSSVVRSHEYYTGTVFEVDYLQEDEINVEIAGGGRYNKLIGKFTEGKIPIVPATGFAYGIQRLLNIWLAQKIKPSVKSIDFFLSEGSEDIAVLSKTNDYFKAFLTAEDIRKTGKRASIYLGDHDNFTKKSDLINKIETVEVE